MMSEMIKVSFPDGAIKEFSKGTTTEEIASSISPGLKKKAIAGKVNNELFDLRRPIEEDAAVEIITQGSDEALEIMRHSSAHLMAQAIKRLYKNVKLGVGPVIESGFYYDIDMEESLTPEDLPKIEKEMKKIINENIEIVRKEVSRDEALKIYEEIGDEYKVKQLPFMNNANSLIFVEGFMFLLQGKLKNLSF